MQWAPYSFCFLMLNVNCYRGIASLADYNIGKFICMWHCLVHKPACMRVQVPHACASQGILSWYLFFFWTAAVLAKAKSSFTGTLLSVPRNCRIWDTRQKMADIALTMCKLMSINVHTHSQQTADHRSLFSSMCAWLYVNGILMA